MNLKKLSDHDLHESAKRSVEIERESTTKVLYHLMEIDRRRLFSKMNYKSLHEYAEKEFKYPGEQAYRRIAAMKLLKELPEIEGKVTTGSLSLTHLSDAKKLFKNKPCTREEKIELMEKLANTTTREAQRIMVEIAPEMAIREKVKPINENEMEFRFTGKVTLDEKLKELRGRLAHTNPRVSLGELVEIMADRVLEALKAEKTKFVAQRMSKDKSPSKDEVIRRIWARDKHRCVKCKSTYALEVDHITPKAKGGRDTFENLRLLCRSCNQRAVIEHYGQQKMDCYF